MRIVLTHAYFLSEDPKEQQIMRPYPPLGILSISAWLDRALIEHDVFDTTFSNKPEFYSYLEANPPQLIGIYVNLMTKLNTLAIISHIRTNYPEAIIVLGGPDGRHHAEKFLNHGADYVVIGEGEVTMTELCATSPHDLKHRQVGHIQGIVFKKDQQLVETPERDKLKNLDDLPIPSRQRINIHHYLTTWKSKHGTSALSVSTMRGCPYTCKWCSRAVYGLSYRRRSPSHVADELELLRQQYQPDTIWFVDDVFTISHKWLTGFHAELQKRNLRIPYECITRSDRMNEEVIRLLKETGCFRVWIGAESGSQKVIDRMDRRVDVNQVRDMIRLTRQHGIQAGTFIMLGYPGETESDINETIHHLSEAEPDLFTITVAYPIKGTELYDEIEEGLLHPPAWEESTDRQLDFQREYPRKYYDYAVRRVVNEVGFRKERKRNGLTWAASRFKIKSIVALAAMQVLKRSGK